MTKYCLDSNAYIQPWNFYYSPQLIPDYWIILDELAQNNVIFSPDEVKQEILKVDDLLNEWLIQRPYFFKPALQPIQLKVREILKIFPRLISVGANRSMADPWVIAQAAVDDAVVVSKEYPIVDPKSKRIKIPDVCKHFEIRCISDITFVNELGIKFTARIE